MKTAKTASKPPPLPPPGWLTVEEAARKVQAAVATAITAAAKATPAVIDAAIAEATAPLLEKIDDLTETSKQLREKLAAAEARVLAAEDQLRASSTTPSDSMSTNSDTSTTATGSSTNSTVSSKRVDSPLEDARFQEVKSKRRSKKSSTSPAIPQLMEISFPTSIVPSPPLVSPKAPTVRAVIRGIPVQTETSVVQDDIAQRGFNPIRVTRMCNLRTKKPMPLLFVVLPNGEENFFSQTQIAGLDVKIETPRKRSPTTQCHNCQQFPKAHKTTNPTLNKAAPPPTSSAPSTHTSLSYAKTLKSSSKTSINDLISQMAIIMTEFLLRLESLQ